MVLGLEQVVTSFFLGVLATAAPCVLPLYPGFLAYLSSSPAAFGKNVNVRWLGFLVFLGVISVMMALGAIIAFLSIAVGSLVAIITPTADILVAILGLLLLIDKNPFTYFPKIAGAKVGSNPYLSAYIYGLLYGPIAFPCSGPFLVAILAISLTAAEFATAFGLFFVFGLGFGIPLFAMSLLARAKQQTFVSWYTKHHRRIEIIAGALLIIIAAYDFWINLPFVLLFLGL